MVPVPCPGTHPECPLGEPTAVSSSPLPVSLERAPAFPVRSLVPRMSPSRSSPPCPPFIIPIAISVGQHDQRVDRRRPCRVVRLLSFITHLYLSLHRGLHAHPMHWPRIGSDTAKAAMDVAGRVFSNEPSLEEEICLQQAPHFPPSLVCAAVFGAPFLPLVERARAAQALAGPYRSRKREPTRERNQRHALLGALVGQEGRRKETRREEKKRERKPKK